METLSKCPVCGFPLTAHFEGEQVTCPNCQSKLETTISDVTIPTPLFAGGLGFFLGALLGPVLMASTKAGQNWLQKQIARER